ncbi:MAG: AbiV family abortive infection protein [Thermoplasmata archaeon]
MNLLNWNPQIVDILVGTYHSHGISMKTDLAQYSLDSVMCSPFTRNLRASEECLDNARQFVEDAERLIESSSFGHAFSLLVLADEEMGKSLMFLFSLFGLSLKRSFLRSHARKQFVQLGVSLAWTFMDLLRIESIMRAAREVKDVEKRKLLIVEEMMRTK